MFWKRSQTSSEDVEHELARVVRAQLSGADEETVQLVTAVAGLLACVAYADQDVTAEEEQQLRSELGRVHDMTARKVDAICGALKQDIVGITTAQAPRFTRTLRDLADRELKLEVLGVLLDLAAADGRITLDEVSKLRNISTAMGLSQADYNELQARHRDKLSFLDS